MCKGYTYDLKCGHQLIHYATRCPLTCSIPSGPREPLNDTCAPCTPSFQIYSHERKKDDIRESCMKAARAARAAGDWETEAYMLGQVAKPLHIQRTGPVNLASQVPRKPPQGSETIIWPGKNEDEETSAPEDTFQVWKECVKDGKPRVL